ncbi:hypothetical protein [Alicyclobacillus sendaiensis]|uniref:hypothetical protein n=1 Tax=Alicyclobacillus sendaiensis TaxID=192387 RepID=UPI0026F45C35|nr:hypothetical protein [Alicyclobacillus sendaiensis]
MSVPVRLSTSLVGAAICVLCAPSVYAVEPQSAGLPNSQVTFTPQEIASQQSYQSQISRKYQNIITETAPNIIVTGGGSLPSSASVSTGTMTEPSDDTTCGPIAAYNLLYHFDGANTPSLVTLEKQLGWTQSQGTPLGNNWISTLNADQSTFSYTVTTSPSVSDVYTDTAVSVSAGAPVIFDIYGYLPGYQSSGPHYLYHYVTGRFYSGYGTNSAAQETIGWYDESNENKNGHYISYSIDTLQSLVGQGRPSINWLGVIWT